MQSESIEYIHEHFRYPDKIAASVPRGFRDRVKLAAAAEGTTSAELIRRTLEDHVNRVLETTKGIRS